MPWVSILSERGVTNVSYRVGTAKLAITDTALVPPI